MAECLYFYGKSLDLGLHRYGYRFVNIDNGWQRTLRTPAWHGLNGGALAGIQVQPSITPRVACQR